MSIISKNSEEALEFTQTTTVHESTSQYKVTSRALFYQDTEDHSLGIQIALEQKFGNQTSALTGFIPLSPAQARMLAVQLRSYVETDPQEKIETLLRQGRVISAIKQYREDTGCGLMEAKNHIDKLRHQKGLI